MCGLFGIINFKPKHINKPMLNVLGITNDTRGGDSCGLFIDGEVEYGFGKTAKYLDFMFESKLLQEKDTARIVLGHCRKASVGGVTLDKAQPTVHRTEDGTIDFVVLHNGTIRNHDELAKKYIPEINTFTWSDSQIMTAIFYNCGYDVLQEYTGGSVFVIADYRGEEPKVMVFQGHSKDKSYDTKTTEERPFYYTRLGQSYVFCSIWVYLAAYAPGKDHACYCVPGNTLVELTNNGLKVIEKYDRSDKVQSEYAYKYPTTGSTTTTAGTVGTSIKEAASSSLNTVVLPSDNTLTYNCVLDKYLIGKQTPAHGQYEATFTGKVDVKFPEMNTYYFWEGVILYNEECFNTLLEIMNKKNMNSSDLLQQYPDLVHFLGPYPWHNCKETFYDMMINRTYWNKIPFTGKVVRIFDLYERSYNAGKQVGQDLFKGYCAGKTAFPKINIDLEAIRKTFLK